MLRLIEAGADEVPELSDEMPVSDMPSLEPTDDNVELPRLEEPSAEPEQD